MFTSTFGIHSGMASTKPTHKSFTFYAAGFNRLQVAEAFFRSEKENELRDIGMNDYQFASDAHLDEVLPLLEKRRCQKLVHTIVTTNARRKDVASCTALTDIGSIPFSTALLLIRYAVFFLIPSFTKKII